MAPPPELIDDVVAEIFLRLPPDEPEHLIRSSLVCKHWFRHLTGPDFLRRYRAFHRTPPLLGYLQRSRFLGDTQPSPGLVPTTSVPLTLVSYFRKALDCHYGRVLLRDNDDDWNLVVWDPITGEQKRVPEPGTDWLFCSAALCCAVSGCDHVDCHGGPFRVVYVGSVMHTPFKACVYSSEMGAWSTPVALSHEVYAVYVQQMLDSFNNGVYEIDYDPSVLPNRGAIIGDEIYFLVAIPAIVKYDLSNNCLSMINPPAQDEDYNVSLMAMEDGSLGFVCIQRFILYLWSRKFNSEGVPEWVQCKVVELGKKIPIYNYSFDHPFVVGAAEGVDAIFVRTGASLFLVKINSGHVKKIGNLEEKCRILPFMSFYTPDCGTTTARKVKGSIDI